MADLTPEDIELMRAALAEHDGAPTGMVGNPDMAADEAGDAAQDREMLKAIVTALEAIIDEVETLKECHIELERKVNEEIIGGVQKLYNENMRMDGIAGIKAKYGEQFSPYEGVFQALADDPNADLYAKLYDKLEEMKKGEGFSEESENGYIQETLGKLKASGPVPSIAVEIEHSEPEEDPIIAKLRAMKQRAGASGSSTY